LESSKIFYENILGLSISGETPKTIRFGTGLALREESFDSSSAKNVKIFLQAQNLNGLRERMINFGYPFVSEIVEKSQRRSFECIDPDGYIVEVVENRKTQ
jgi:predicted enzyme related to lactoylglutathione lyase